MIPVSNNGHPAICYCKAHPYFPSALLRNWWWNPSLFRALTELLKQPGEAGGVDRGGGHHPIGSNGISGRSMRTNNGKSPLQTYSCRVSAELNHRDSQTRWRALWMGKHQIIQRCSPNQRLNFIFESITSEIWKQQSGKLCFVGQVNAHVQSYKQASHNTDWFCRS